MYFKSEIINAEFSEELSFFAVLLGTHTFVIVNTLGFILTTFSEEYSSFCIHSEYLFLGGNSLQIFSLKNYSLLSEILNSSEKIDSILINGGNIGCIKFENSTINIIELDSGKILKITAYHSTKINSLAWTTSGDFFSCGEESCLYIWTKQDIGWGLEAVELTKDYITAIDCYDNFVAIGFSNGIVNVYDEGLNIFACCRPASDRVVELCFTRSGVLVLCFASGLVTILDGNYCKAAAVLQEKWKSAPRFVKVSVCEVIENHDNLILACTMKDYFNLSIHRIAKKETCRPIGFTNITLDYKFIDFKLHTSGKYIIVSLEIENICIYEIISGSIVGVIEAGGLIEIDYSGLYLAAIEGFDIYKLSIFELGTGEKVSEMGRIVNGKNIK